MARADALQAPTKAGGYWIAAWRSINSAPILAASVLLIFSVAVSPLLLIPTKTISGTLPTGGLFVQMADFFNKYEALALLLIGFNFGSVFCHFLYDRAVFRFSDPDTREVSGRLLFSSK